MLLCENIIGDTIPYHHYVNSVKFLLAKIKKHAKGMLNIVIIHLVDQFLRSQLFYLLVDKVRSGQMFPLKVNQELFRIVVRMHQYSDILYHIWSVVL